MAQRGVLFGATCGAMLGAMCVCVTLDAGCSIGANSYSWWLDGQRTAAMPLGAADPSPQGRPSPQRLSGRPDPAPSWRSPRLVASTARPVAARSSAPQNPALVTSIPPLFTRLQVLRERAGSNAEEEEPDPFG